MPFLGLVFNLEAIPSSPNAELSTDEVADAFRTPVVTEPTRTLSRMAACRP
jgi:hypothetical protein